MKKIIIANNKGGVGKATIASQTVYALADRGHSVIGVDLDSQRNFTGSFDTAKDLGSAPDQVVRGTPIEADVNAGEIGILFGHKDLLAQNADDVLVNVRNGLMHSRGANFCVIDAPPGFSGVVDGALLGSDYLLVPIELKRDALVIVAESFERLLVPHAIRNRSAYAGPGCGRVAGRNQDAQRPGGGGGVRRLL